MVSELEMLRDLNEMLETLQGALCGKYKVAANTIEMNDGTLQITDLQLMQEEIKKGGGQ